MFERGTQCRNTCGSDVVICRKVVLADLTREWVNVSLK